MNPDTGEIHDIATREALLREFNQAGKLTDKELKEEMEKLHGWPKFDVGAKIDVKGHEFKIKYINTRTHEIVLISTKIKKKF